MPLASRPIEELLNDFYDNVIAAADLVFIRGVNVGSLEIDGSAMEKLSDLVDSAQRSIEVLGVKGYADAWSHLADTGNSLVAVAEHLSRHFEGAETEFDERCRDVYHALPNPKDHSAQVDMEKIDGNYSALITILSDVKDRQGVCSSASRAAAYIHLQMVSVRENLRPSVVLLGLESYIFVRSNLSQLGPDDAWERKFVNVFEHMARCIGCRSRVYGRLFEWSDKYATSSS